MDPCVVCRRPLAAGEVILCTECAAPEAVSQGGRGLVPCVVCRTLTSGTYDGEFPVCGRRSCAPCYATGRLTKEHIASYGRHTEEAG